ncbi:MAG: glycosyl hydrolase family 8 [Faecousia sp.]
MKHDFPARLEKAILVLICLLAVVILAGTLYLLRSRPPEEPVNPPTEGTTEPVETPTETLAGPDFYLPEKLVFGQQLPYTLFQDAQGQQIDLQQAYAGSRVVLMYWGSWCPYCEKQLEHLEEFRRVVEASENTRLVLVDKTDREKDETVEKAEAYLAEKGWQDFDRVYDVELAAYHAYGMKRIPTTIIIDEQGYVRAVVSEVLNSGEELAQLLEQSITGNAGPLLDFLKNRMRNEQGGLYLSYRESAAASPKGHDVLSESMGLLMRCAVKLNDRELFDQSWNYVSGMMRRSGVFAWYVDSKGKQAGSNALLDDLRIARALSEADAKWGGYQDALSDLAMQLLVRNTYRGQLSSFYDFSQRCAGSSICLAYADFSTLEMLAEREPSYRELTDSLKTVVSNGFIGTQFPLYYASYDYKRQSYSQESLNTAEALLTLYHLCGTELLQPDSLAWLKEAIRTDTLAARYEVDGTPVPGYQYDSTAVFAIAALIGQAAGDAELYSSARAKMEQVRVSDPESPFFGTFCNSDNGSDLNSFDQLMPLLVYCESRSAKFQ